MKTEMDADRISQHVQIDPPKLDSSYCLVLVGRGVVGNRRLSLLRIGSSAPGPASPVGPDCAEPLYEMVRRGSHERVPPLRSFP